MPTSTAREIHIEFDQRVPMRDGITLSADIYLPIDSSYTSRKYPVILTRTPYLKLSERMLVPAKYFAERGYVFVATDVRGRGDSDGRQDAADGWHQQSDPGRYPESVGQRALESRRLG